MSDHKKDTSRCLDCGSAAYKLHIRKRFNGKRKIVNVGLNWCDTCQKVV